MRALADRRVEVVELDREDRRRAVRRLADADRLVDECTRSLLAEIAADR